MNVTSVPFSKLDILESDLAAVREVLESGWVTHGKYTKLFEELFCQFTGARHAITVSNCTAGLHLSCQSQRIGPGDEVIVPAQTHTATAHAVEYTGARAVFADVDPLFGTILPADIEKRITSRTKGVIVVHMAGFACEMDRIDRLCKDHGLFLIEDCAHALGTTYRGKHVGSWGVCGNYSFYPTKQISTGEGGMVTANDERVAHFIKTHKAFGIDTPPEMRTVPGIYDVKGLGMNYRMTDFQAALGYGQLTRYGKNLEKRRANARFLIEELKDLKCHIDFPDYQPESSYFLFQILLKQNESRNRLVKRLIERGVGCSIHYATAVPFLSYYANKYTVKKSDYPNAVTYGKSNISLPLHPYLEKAQLHYVAETLRSLLLDSPDTRN